MIKKTFLERQYLKSSKNKVVFINNVVQVTYSLNIGFTDKSRTIIKSQLTLFYQGGGNFFLHHWLNSMWY